MDEIEAIETIARGEDSRHQFKLLFGHEKQAAAEMAAFSNGEGGHIFIGVKDDGSIVGLTQKQVHTHNQLISNAATQHIRNPINPRTQNLTLHGRTVMIVTVGAGNDKPYFDSDGIIWQKVGSDKRKVMVKEELRRLFQTSDLLQADEIPVRGCDVGQLNRKLFDRYHAKRFKTKGKSLSMTELNALLENSNLGRGGELNLAGLLLFGQNPQRFKPAFVVKAVRFVGASVTGDQYDDSEDFEGPLGDQFAGAISFIGRNLQKGQAGQSVNSRGVWPVPRAVFEELLVNALLHRNYLLNAPIRLICYADRVEIVSPGSLPNHLTVEHIRNGNSSLRNAVLTSFAANGLLPYRGFASGVPRALELNPGIDFQNDSAGELFRAIIPLPVVTPR